MDTHLLWAITLVGALLVLEAIRAELRDHMARRAATKRGRTLTARYGVPWR